MTILYGILFAIVGLTVVGLPVAFFVILFGPKDR